jgi:hypothetical protein
MPKKSPIKTVVELKASAPFSESIEKMSVADRVEAYAIIQDVQDAAKDRRESLRESLLEYAAQHGIPNEKGGHKLVVGDHTVLRERRTSSSPDEKKLTALLEAKGIPLEKAFDKVTVFEPNVSKLNALVATGHLAEDDVKALFKVNYALVVHPGASLVESLSPKKPVVG